MKQQRIAGKALTTLSLAALSIGSLGCQFIARGPAKYEKDTTAVLQTANDAIKACYDEVLKSNKDAQGTVVARVVVREESGNLSASSLREANAQAASAATTTGTAPWAVKECVADALKGLKLAPPDARMGIGTYTYEFD